MLRLALAICLSSTTLLVAVDNAESKLPPAAATAVDALQREIGKNYAAYRSAVQKASERTAKDLQRAMSDATKKGDLDTATAVKAMLDELNAGKLQERLEALERRDIDLLGEAAPADDVLKAALCKGDWILERNGVRNLLHFDHWAKADGDATAHWTCTVAPDVAITLLSGIRMSFKSTSLAVDTEFVSEPATGRLVAPNTWVIRHPTASEDLPAGLEAGLDGQGRLRGGAGRRR